MSTHPDQLIGEEAFGSDRAVVTCLADVQSEAVEWLWPDRLARGKMTIVAGAPGTGKSIATLDAAARVTQGVLWPDGGRASVGSVLVLGCEDGLADTMRPRADAAGADLRKLFVLSGIEVGDGETRHFDLGQDLERLRTQVEKFDPKLVIIDPLSAYLPKVDSWRDNEVRAALSPLAQLAEDARFALCCVMHFSKNAGSRALDRILGSVAFTGQARIALAVVPDPDNPERRFLLPVKSNLSKPAETLAFSIGDNRVTWESGPVRNVSADVLLDAQPADAAERTEAEHFLRETLADGNPMAARDVLLQARAAGIAERSLRRAKNKLGVTVLRRGYGKEGTWHWQLPASKAATYSE